MNDSASAHRIRVRIAECKVAKGDAVLVAVGLGSCVAVAIWDGQREVGGMSHILLPGKQKIGDNPNKFCDSAIQALVEGIRSMGGEIANMKAKLAGGANMFAWIGDSKKSIGERNVAAAKEKLGELGITVEAEDIGGHEGRTVEFHAATGGFLIRNARGEEKQI